MSKSICSRKNSWQVVFIVKIVNFAVSNLLEIFSDENCISGKNVVKPQNHRFLRQKEEKENCFNSYSVILLEPTKKLYNDWQTCKYARSILESSILICINANFIKTKTYLYGKVHPILIP